MPVHPRGSGQIESGVRIGDFEIEKRLGAGGMGIVYRARQVSLDRVVALKVLGPALTRPTDLERFQREARAAARLKHPGITAIYFIGQDAEVCYHVMEFVDGVPLQRVIERLSRTKDVVTNPDTVVADELTTQPDAPAVRFDGPTADGESTPGDSQRTLDFVPAGAARSGVSISPGGKQTRRNAQYVRRSCEIVRDVARALAYAHGEGVVHRDIKPENLMLDQAGKVRVIDFGLARYFDDDSITRTGQLLGTPLYMSPEQVTGRFKVDHRSDIYSLGLVLYEMLALRRPFELVSRENLLRDIVTKALPPLGGRNPSLPKALEAVAHKATHKDPEERYQSAAEFADDLDAFLAGKPVSAPPYRYRLDLQEVLSRRPGGVVLASFICLLLGSAVFVALASVGVMTFFMTKSYGIVLVQILPSVFIMLVAAYLSRGLLAGREWVRWVVVGLSVFLLLLLLTGVTVYVTVFLPDMLRNSTQPGPLNGDESGPGFDAKGFMIGMVAMYSIPVILAVLCTITTLVCLLSRRTRSWFRLARQSRLEHAELVRTLAD